MANTLTAVIPTLYNALDTVSREVVGFIPSVRRDVRLERAAVGQPITSPVTSDASAVDITPAMTIPEGTDQTVGSRTITIGKSRGVQIPWTGEEQKSLSNGDAPQIDTILSDQFQQAMRTIVNEVETDLAALYVEASNAYGTAGTTPFASTLGDAAQIGKLLSDNGAPPTGRSLVGGTAMGANLRTLTNLTQVNAAGTDRTLRGGVLLPLLNLDIRESAQVQTHTAGTAASATTDDSGYAVGATTITLASAGTGTIVAGDVITFAGDTNKYVVATGDADVSGGGTIVLAAPGLKVAIAASTTAITVIKEATALNYTANMAFSRSAIDLVFRLPALPNDGDAAKDRISIVDPVSNLMFEIAIYEGYRKKMYEISAAWGVKVSKPEHCVVLLG